MRYSSAAVLLAVLVGLVPSLSAQSPDPPPPPAFPRFLPRVEYRYDAGNGVGRQGDLSTLDVFVPWYDFPARNELIFRDARFAFYHENGIMTGNLGGGYRRYLPEIDATLGGYGYYDYTYTHEGRIHQAALGVEFLGDLVDARANGYIPFEGSRAFLGTAFTPNTDSVFQGNYLLVNGGTTTQVYRQALAGCDAEAGLRLYANSVMEMRGFAGGYYYTGTGTEDIVGPRLRLEGRIYDHGTVGLSYQYDRVFKSTVNLTLSIAFPRLSGRRASDGPPAPVAPSDRLGDPVVRTSYVALQRQEKATTVARDKAIDPLTGRPLFFLHVAPGGAGNGTFESPFGALGQAVADPRFKAGNLVVYDRTRDTFAGNITLAPGTRLLSDGPVQRLQTTNAGVVTLPYSGTNPDLSSLPTVAGTVTLASDSTLSGYNVTPVPGIDAVTTPTTGIVRNVLVDSNVITGGNRGVGLNDVTGDVAVTNNVISGTLNSAIQVGVQQSTSANLTLSGNTITAPNQDGIEVLVNSVSGAGSSVTALISNNQITAATNNGITLQNEAASSLTATLSNNTVNLSVASGVALFSNSGTNTAQITLANNSVTNSGGGLGNPDVLADYSRGSSTTVTLRADGNTATPNGYLFQQAGGTVFNVVNLATFSARNTGPLNTTGTINDVPGP